MNDKIIMLGKVLYLPEGDKVWSGDVKYPLQNNYKEQLTKNEWLIIPTKMFNVYYQKTHCDVAL